MRIFSFVVSVGLSLSFTGVGIASEEQSPVVDRVILRQKPPEVDRVILRERTEQPVVDRVILRRRPDPASSEPTRRQPSPIVEDDGTKHVDAGDIPRVASPSLRSPVSGPTGTTLLLSYGSASALDRVQLGVGYWFSDTWGVALRTGFSSTSDEKSIATSAGPRVVSTHTWLAAPDVSMLYAPVVKDHFRLVLETGGGLHFWKPERETPMLNYHAHVGPGFQWFALSHLSLQLGQRVYLLTKRNINQIDFGLSTQLTATYWFE